MRLDVSKALVAEGQEVPFALTGSLVDTVLMGEAVAFPAPVRLRGHYASVGERILVRGTMAFEASSRCVRCLAVAAHEFCSPFAAEFALTPDPDNPDVYVYDGAWIDLTQMASDTALLALPMQWVCLADCKGLCPQCGADRNTTPCSCPTGEAREHPFAALQQLLTQDESEV